MKFKNILNKYREIVFYGIIGGFSAALDFCIYTLLVICKIEFLYANAIGVISGILTSFMLNRKYNFKVLDNTKKRFFSFFIIGCLGLLISSCLLYFLVNWLEFNELYSKLITIITISLLQYILNKTITFKKI